MCWDTFIFFELAMLLLAKDFQRLCLQSFLQNRIHKFIWVLDINCVVQLLHFLWIVRSSITVGRTSNHVSMCVSIHVHLTNKFCTKRLLPNSAAIFVYSCTFVVVVITKVIACKSGMLVIRSLMCSIISPKLAV